VLFFNIKRIDTRLFRENPNEFYTHYDLMRAKELGYKIRLIEDDDLPNVLIYLPHTLANRISSSLHSTGFEQRSYNKKSAATFIVCQSQ